MKHQKNLVEQKQNGHLREMAARRERTTPEILIDKIEK
jgi:hypothetical protein